MQTLGLASEQKPTDGLLKRLFWPTIENEQDVDLIRRQGFWLCMLIAATSTIALLVTGHAILGIASGLTYVLAASGIREGSIGAAVIVFLCYFCDRVAAVEAMMVGFGASSPVVGLFVLALLLSNIRGTILAKRWQRSASASDIDEVPESVNLSVMDKFVNGMPAAVWPKGQFVFFPLGLALVILSIIGMVMLPGIQRKRAAQTQQQREMQLTLPSQ